ncbi:MAG TPA: hypothetical protein VHZ51_05350 [Ktedonobacteraceae bacterium]|nr:hypothetical protein [Ktedonobacteraceae bacterium]
METTVDGTFLQEEDYIRVKSTGETGRVNAIAGGVVYVLMDTTNESKLFAASIDEDAAIELVRTENTTDDHDDLPFSVQLSEQWLLERTYHAQLLNERELSIANLTNAMKQLIDISVPSSSQSSKSRLPERLPIQKSSTFSVPISTWREITQKEAQLTYQQGTPVLLYSEHTWEHSQKTPGSWRPNRNMRAIIDGNTLSQPEATSGIDYAVCYLDTTRGTFSNDSWKRWFSSVAASLFNDHDQPITFLRPCIQFPFTTHYTVIAADGRVTEYPGHAEALQGFATAPLQEVRHGNAVQTVALHFCYYYEVTCPSGTYRLEFFGPRMNEQGYMPTEQPLALV